MKKLILLLGTLVVPFYPALGRGQGCPTYHQKILVLDLKSGWWGGDGGDFHQKFYDRLEKRCPGLIEFEFRHTPYGAFQTGSLSPFQRLFGVESQSGRRHLPLASLNGIVVPARANLPPEDWESYQQIWVLSGGEADSADMRIESAEFKSILQGIAGSYANVFIGTGFGNIYHANPVAEVMGGGQPFATDKITDIFPVPTSTQSLTWLEKGTGLVNHPLFDGVSKLPERVNVGGFVVESDWLKPESAGLFGKLAVNAAGQTVIAATCGCSGRTTLVDTGLQRAYPLVGDFPETFEYLLAAILFLEKAP